MSYAHDDEARVRSIVDDLTSRGIEVWWDELLQPGDEWGLVLRDKLRDASCVVVMWSRSSVRSRFVESEARAALDHARGTGRLVPVLLDADAAADIPLPFNVLQFQDLTAWDGRARRPLTKLATVVTRLVERPPRGEEAWGANLSDDGPVRSARRASREMTKLTLRAGSIGEVLVGDDAAINDLRAALDQVHETLDVVTGAVTDFVAAGLGETLDPRPYVAFERGALRRRVEDGRGHCDLIALHYARPGGVRSWLQANASKRTLTRADDVFRRLSEADVDLFRELARIGDVLTNESRVIVNLLTAGQPKVARQRVLEGRRRLAPLEAELGKGTAELQTLERRLGFAHRPAPSPVASSAVRGG